VGKDLQAAAEPCPQALASSSEVDEVGQGAEFRSSGRSRPARFWNRQAEDREVRPTNSISSQPVLRKVYIAILDAAWRAARCASRSIRWATTAPSQLRITRFPSTTVEVT